MATCIEEVLGKNDQLYRPGNRKGLLPSPAQLIGKVVVKCKIPDGTMGSNMVLNDDFDDELRNCTPPIDTNYDSEDDVAHNVVGFDSKGSIRDPKRKRKVSADAVFQNARHESLEANSAARNAHEQLTDIRRRAKQSLRHSDALLRDVGMTYEELKKKREECDDNLIEEGTEVELSSDGARVKESANHALAIARAFAESVEDSRLLMEAANIEARSEEEIFELAREELVDKEAVLAEAVEELDIVSSRNREAAQIADRALVEARMNAEFAENAAKRVDAVKGLLSKSHNQAVSSETVAGTADAEAKISEKRALEAEKRASRARDEAEKHRLRAEEESKKEDDLILELEGKVLHEWSFVKLSEKPTVRHPARPAEQEQLKLSQDAVDAARERADTCVEKADQLTDQIRMVKSNDDPDLSIEESSLIASQKTKERKDHIKEMEDALIDKLARETR